MPYKILAVHWDHCKYLLEVLLIYQARPGILSYAIVTPTLAYHLVIEKSQKSLSTSAEFPSASLFQVN